MNITEKLQQIYQENYTQIARLEKELSLFKEKSKKKREQKENLSFLFAIPLSLGTLLLARLGYNVLPAMAKYVLDLHTPLVLLGLMAGFDIAVKKGWERRSGVWKAKKNLLKGKTRQEQEEEILKKEILKKQLENRNEVIVYASKSTSTDSSLKETYTKGRKDVLKKCRKKLFHEIQSLKENYQQLDTISSKQVVASKLQYYQSCDFEEEKMLSILKGVSYAWISFTLSVPFLPQVENGIVAIAGTILTETLLISCIVPYAICEQKKKRNIKMLSSMNQGEDLGLKEDENYYTRTRKVEEKCRKILDQTNKTC